MSLSLRDPRAGGCFGAVDVASSSPSASSAYAVDRQLAEWLFRIWESALATGIPVTTGDFSSEKNLYRDVEAVGGRLRITY
jgi:hypothetical protein